MNITDFQKKMIWGVGVLSIVCLWIAFPFIFKLLIEAYKFPKDFTDFGPFGDIYGSLNTLISSIALCAVAFSTYLQVTSIRETRETNTKQLNLAKEAHDEQVKESRNAIFANKFYSLLNYKDEMLKTLVVKKDNKIHEGRKIFDIYFNYFENLIDNDWKDLKRFNENVIINEIRKCDLASDEGIEFNDWYSHFLKIADIIKLIKNSELLDSEKDFFFSVLRSSMTMREQITLFWVAPVVPQVYPILEDSKIFNLFYGEKFIPYGQQFYKRGHFNSNSWKNVFDETQTPA
ncbi:TPA: hypothetical protein JI044_16480 [Acinetobacter baumannii]|nr:hypothetical protein [Acinetobacter baumannii]HAV5400516.1 hypothetical protein [Acinetobacter baumannii]